MAAVAGRQWGVVTVEQLAELGFSRSARRWAVASGRLRHVTERVLVVPGSPDTWFRRATAAVLAAGPGAVLSHASAAHLYELDGFDAPPDTIEVTVPRRRRRVVPDGTVQHLPRTEVRRTLWKGLPVTQLSRTVVDVAASRTPEELEVTLDSAARMFHQFGRWLAKELAAFCNRGTAGVAHLRRILSHREGTRTDSALETRVRQQLRASGLPPPVPQHRAYDDDGCIMRVDFAWPRHKVALHVDSFRWHARKDRFERDVAQRNRLLGAGWRSLVVTHDSLDQPWLAVLAAALAEDEP